MFCFSKLSKNGSKFPFMAIKVLARREIIIQRRAESKSYFTFLSPSKCQLNKIFWSNNFLQWKTFKTRVGQPSIFQFRDKETATKGKDVTLSKEELERVKAVFAEGYIAGQQAFFPASPKPWRMIIALLSGIFVGLFLPLFFISSFQGAGTKNVEVEKESVKTKFSDVKGVDEAKQELQELVEFLRHPEKFLALGGKLPRGVLLVGPPGTGKTLLARALAGEAGVPYFQMSGSEFEQTFVGEGARRVRDLFRVAKRNAPCVVFIDEIDSVGSKRINSSLHPHSNQTINQLLTEMDGFHRNEGIIVVGATNRREDLDKALLRPGRFDVEITVAPPSFTGRKEILEHFLSKICSEDIDIESLARGTVGFTGADIENMVNRAALRAAMNGAGSVSIAHLYAERDRLLMGVENKTRISDDQSNKITAYHEMGHCLVAMLTPHSQPVHQVSIIPRGNVLGHTAYLPAKDEIYVTKAQLQARLDALLGGRAAEELIFGPDLVTSGAASDLKSATKLARLMVSHWGMSERVGLLAGNQEKEDSPAYRNMVDEEVQRLLQDSYERAKNLLQRHSQQHGRLAEALLRYETLDANDIQSILSNKKLKK